MPRNITYQNKCGFVASECFILCLKICQKDEGIWKNLEVNMVRDSLITNEHQDDSCDPPIQFSDWYSFSELNHFDSDVLIRSLTAKDESGLPFLWNDLPTLSNCPRNKHGNKPALPVIALKQAESLFNLSQLMFALYHGSLSACTFLDLQLNNLPKDIRHNGFKKLDNMSVKSGSSFRKALHSLCWDIAERGGLPVIFSMIKNPVIPVIHQKCLDALTNILCVDHIERIVLLRQPWFLKKLLSNIRSGDLQCEMVPAISVIDRLIVVVLSDKSKVENIYDHIMHEELVETIINRLKDSKLQSDHFRHHYLKFQTIAMQAIALLCHDARSTNWPIRTRNLAFDHAYHCFIMWDAEHPPSDPKWHRSENFYQNMSFCSSTLLFSLMVVIHAALKWPDKREYLLSQGLVLKYHLSQMIRSVQEENSKDDLDPNTLAVKCAVDWLWDFLYNTNENDLCQSEDLLTRSISKPLSELCERVLRKCSNSTCHNIEYEPNQFSLCKTCDVTCYCSIQCKNEHKQSDHDQETCNFLSMRDGGQMMDIL